MTALDRLSAAVRRINDVLLAACRGAIIALMTAIAVIMMAAVLWRYGLNNAISWSEEAAKYLMVWLAFVGAPVALRVGGHVSIDLLVRSLPARIAQLLHALISLTVIGIMVMLVWKGWGVAQVGARQVASTFGLSMVYVYAAVPLGAALTGLVALEQLLAALRGIADPARGFDPDAEGRAFDEARG